MATHPLKGPLISFPRYAEDMKVPTRMVRRWPYPVSCRSCRQLDGSALFRYWEKFLRLLRTVCEATRSLLKRTFRTRNSNHIPFLWRGFYQARHEWHGMNGYYRQLDKPITLTRIRAPTSWISFLWLLRGISFCEQSFCPAVAHSSLSSTMHAFSTAEIWGGLHAVRALYGLCPTTLCPVSSPGIVSIWGWCYCD